MASNLQLIFFRNKKNPEILVKVLYNGHEAMLPLPEALHRSIHGAHSRISTGN